MAYLRDLQIKCSTPYCNSRASVEVIDRFNDGRGRFCKKCGAKRLKELEKAEKNWPTPGVRA